MPDVSGFDATSTIRHIEASRGSRQSHIVALTSLTSDKDRRAARFAGADEFFTKPAGVETVKGIIDKWVAELKVYSELDGRNA